MQHTSSPSPKQNAVSTLHVLLILGVLALLTGLLASCSSNGKQQDSGLPPEPPPPGDPGTSFAGKAVSYGEVILGNYAPPYELPNHYLSRGTFLRTPSGSAPFFYTLADASPVVVEGGSVSLTTKALAPGGLIYNKGYVYTKTGPSPWMPFSLVPDVEEGVDSDTFIRKRIDENGDIVPTNWIMQKARADLSYTADDFYNSFFEGENFILNYVCLKPNPVEPWKCGCKAPRPGDSSSSDCGYWMLQTFDVCPVGEEWNDNAGACGLPGASLTTPEPICGDGIVTLGREQCDDGDSTTGNGCDANCNVEAGWSCNANEPSGCAEDTFPVGQTSGGGSAPQEPRCGDGIVNRAEEYCDDGNAIEADSCTSSCKPSLVCAGLPGSTIASLDIQLIVDTSGSMEDPSSDPRIKQTVRALRGTDAYPNIGFVDKIFAMPNGANNKIGLTEFSGDASTVFSLSQSLSSLENSIAIIPGLTFSSTGTNYEAGLTKGLLDLCDNEGADCTVDQSDSDVAVFMTDGEPLKCTTCGNSLTTAIEPGLMKGSDGLYYCSSNSYYTLNIINQYCPMFTKSLIKQALLLSQEYRTKGARLFVIGFDVKQLPDVCTDEVKLAALAVSSPELTDDEAIALAKCPEVLLKKMALLGGGEYYTAKTTANAAACDAEPDSAACICSSDPQNVACIYSELNKAYEDIASVASCMNSCGDATTSGTEACDDGNGINNDACKNDCTENTCGDLVIETGVEECDGNEGCNADCTLDQTTSSPRDEVEQALGSALAEFSSGFNVDSFIIVLLANPELIQAVLLGQSDRNDAVTAVQTILSTIESTLTDTTPLVDILLDQSLSSSLQTYFSSINGCLDDSSCSSGLVCSMALCSEQVYTESCTATDPGVNAVTCIPLGTTLIRGSIPDSIAESTCLDETTVTYPTCYDNCGSNTATYDCTQLSTLSQYVCLNGACVQPNWQTRTTFVDGASHPISGVHGELTQNGEVVFSGDSDTNGALLVSVPQGTYHAVITKEGFETIDADVLLAYTTDNPYDPQNPVQYVTQTLASLTTLTGRWTLPVQNDVPDNQIVEFTTDDNAVWVGHLVDLGQQIGSFGFAVCDLTFDDLRLVSSDNYEGQILFKYNDGTTITEQWRDVRLTITPTGIVWSVNGAAMDSMWERVGDTNGGTSCDDTGGAPLDEPEPTPTTYLSVTLTPYYGDAYATLDLLSSDIPRLARQYSIYGGEGALLFDYSDFISLDTTGDLVDDAGNPNRYLISILDDAGDGNILPTAIDGIEIMFDPARSLYMTVNKDTGEMEVTSAVGYRSTLQFTVTDPTGSPLPDAVITVIGETGVVATAKTGTLGVASTQVNQGSYTVTITPPVAMSGLTPITIDSLVVSSGTVSQSVQLLSTPTCSDGIKNQGETAVDCGGSICPACAVSRADPVCGDGAVDSGEQCDDGNTAKFDNCDATCKVELIKNGGFELMNTIPIYSGSATDPPPFGTNGDALWRLTYAHENEWLTYTPNVGIDKSLKFSGLQSARMKGLTTMVRLGQMVPVPAGDYQFTAQVQSQAIGALILTGTNSVGSVFFTKQIGIENTFSAWSLKTSTVTLPSNGYLYVEATVYNDQKLLNIDDVSLTLLPPSG